MPEIFASLGSNQNREYNISSVIKMLRSYYGELRLSPVYQNRAVGFEGDDFLNMVIAFTTDIAPEVLWQQFRDIEDAHGRLRGGRKFASRRLDIDLILYGDLVCNKKMLKLPREDIINYAFVLRPLVDLEPQGEHPELKTTYAQIWASFEGERELDQVDIKFD